MPPTDDPLSRKSTSWIPRAVASPAAVCATADEDRTSVIGAAPLRISAEPPSGPASTIGVGAASTIERLTTYSCELSRISRPSSGLAAPSLVARSAASTSSAPSRGQNTLPVRGTTAAAGPASARKASTAVGAASARSRALVTSRTVSRDLDAAAAIQEVGAPCRLRVS